MFCFVWGFFVCFLGVFSWPDSIRSVRPKLISVYKAASLSSLIGCSRQPLIGPDPLFSWLSPASSTSGVARRSERQMRDPRGAERSGAVRCGAVSSRRAKDKSRDKF